MVEFLNDIITNHKENLVKNLCAALFAFCKKNIEKMFLYSPVTTDIICSVTPFFMLVVKDLCKYKLNSMVTAKEANTSKQYLVIKFVNKLVERVKLKEIISCETPRSAFPFNVDVNGFQEPCISYKYSNTIRSEVVNYRQAIVDEETHPAACNCSSYDKAFIDNHHNHIFTGNLGITSNNSLKTLLGKGLNYRVHQPPNKAKAFESIVSALDSYIRGMATTLNKPVNNFGEWKSVILAEVKKRLDKIKP